MRRHFAALSPPHSSAMVRLTSSLALLALAAAPAVHAGPLALLQRASDGAVRFGLGRVLRLNETQIDRLLNRDGTPLEPHPHACASRCFPSHLARVG